MTPDEARELAKHVKPPVAIVLGQPDEVLLLAEALGTDDAVCYQQDVYLADRLRVDLATSGLRPEVAVLPDLWDLPARFRSVIYPTALAGERELKLDMIEQASHILLPHGAFVAVSPYEADQLLPGALKKVYGRVQSPAWGGGRVFIGHREKERPRRRHEVTFQARFGEGPSLRFLSRPGVFAYGRFDDGARALVETMVVEPGDQVLDLGCGCGTNGVCAGRLAGPTGAVTFVDSNVRAVALTEHNARENGLASFRVATTPRAEGPGLLPGAFDVVLANPPYFAQTSIASLFITRGRQLLRPGGRFYLVTKQPQQVGEMVAEAFDEADLLERRGYVILAAVAPE